MNWLFNVTFNDISDIHVMAHIFASGLKKKFDMIIIFVVGYIYRYVINFLVFYIFCSFVCFAVWSM